LPESKATRVRPLGKIEHVGAESMGAERLSSVGDLHATVIPSTEPSTIETELISLL
jgi:hypothetical protein